MVGAFSLTHSDPAPSRHSARLTQVDLSSSSPSTILNAHDPTDLLPARLLEPRTRTPRTCASTQSACRSAARQPGTSAGSNLHAASESCPRSARADSSPPPPGAGGKITAAQDQEPYLQKNSRFKFLNLCNRLSFLEKNAVRAGFDETRFKSSRNPASSVAADRPPCRSRAPLEHGENAEGKDRSCSRQRLLARFPAPLPRRQTHPNRSHSGGISPLDSFGACAEKQCGGGPAPEAVRKRGDAGQVCADESCGRGRGGRRPGWTDRNG